MAATAIGVLFSTGVALSLASGCLGGTAGPDLTVTIENRGSSALTGKLRITDPENKTIFDDQVRIDAASSRDRSVPTPHAGEYAARFSLLEANVYDSIDTRQCPTVTHYHLTFLVKQTPSTSVSTGPNNCG